MLYVFIAIYMPQQAARESEEKAVLRGQDCSDTYKTCALLNKK
jgi:hypothetical protein